jgi:hypothetical protein
MLFSADKGCKKDRGLSRVLSQRLNGICLGARFAQKFSGTKSYLVTANHDGAKVLLRNVSGFRVGQPFR